ncbi:MAG: hypothetical protein U0470_12295 [Anaerolineae bacterium]
MLYNWVDPSPFPTNIVKRMLWQLTGPDPRAGAPLPARDRDDRSRRSSTVLSSWHQAIAAGLGGRVLRADVAVRRVAEARRRPGALAPTGA